MRRPKQARPPAVGTAACRVLAPMAAAIAGACCKCCPEGMRCAGGDIFSLAPGCCRGAVAPGGVVRDVIRSPDGISTQDVPLAGAEMPSRQQVTVVARPWVGTTPWYQPTANEDIAPPAHQNRSAVWPCWRHSASASPQQPAYMQLLPTSAQICKICVKSSPPGRQIVTNRKKSS